MSVAVRTTHLEVTIDGALDTTAFAATVSLGFDQRYAEATVRRTGGGTIAVSYWSDVEISMGATPGEGAALRFAGYAIPIDNVLYPVENVLHCRGRLYRAAFVKNTEPGGTQLVPPRDDPTLPGTGSSDEQQVKDVLGSCGVTFDEGDIEGTGKALGSIFIDLDNVLSPGPFTWAEGASGLDYIEQLDEVSVPDDGSGRYRTFEGLGGVVQRRKLATEPSPSEDASFTEGVDVLEARIARDPTGAANRITVTGAPTPGEVALVGATGVTLSAAARFTVASSFADYLPAGVSSVTHELSSPMIEKSTIAQDGDVISCQQVADFLLTEHNTVVDTLDLSTPRDDPLSPGMSVHLHSPRLGLTDPTRHYWLQHLEVAVDERGAFTQRLTCLRKS